MIQLVPFVLAGAAAWLFALNRASVETAPLISTVAGTTKKSKMGNIFSTYGNILSSLAAEIGIPVSTAAAVLAVESNGTGFGKNNRLIIRFEPATFRKYTNQTVADTHKNQDAEYAAFENAKYIDENAAFMSISMGLAQIMGFNHKMVGYSSPHEMFDDFSSSSDAQITAMFRFIQKKPVCLKAAKSDDFAAFAHGYNGSGYAANKYDTKISSAKQAFTDATGIV